MTPVKSPLVEGVLNGQREAALLRVPWEARWTQISDVALINAEPFPLTTTSRYDIMAQGPRSPDRARTLYDSTAVTALDRLAAGLLNLVSPEAQKWHDLGSNDPFNPEPQSKEEEIWYDRVRDYLFTQRYNPRSGFPLSNLTSIRASSSLGTGFMFVEDSIGGMDVPIKYSFMPLSQCYASVDAQGHHDTMYRRWAMSARAAVKRWGEKCSKSIQDDAKSKSDRERKYEFIHAVVPRGTYGAQAIPPGAQFESHYIEVDHEHHIGSKWFVEFPYIPFAWERETLSPYGESPMMRALADIQSLQVVAKSEIKSVASAAKPPLLVAHDGVTNRINLNPGAVMRGGIDAAGNRTVVPMAPDVNALNFVETILNAKQERVEKSLYIHLFQILVNRGSDTATEALLRANEKGELLGPAGSSIQYAHALMVERELGILRRKGAFDSDSVMRMPQSLIGKSPVARSRTPLDRIRRSSDMLGTQQYLQTGALLAELGMPEALDDVDPDAVMKLSREVNGAPALVSRDPEARDQIRKQRAEQQQMQQMMQMAQQGVETAGGAGEAAEGIQRAMQVGNGEG